jgi:hypothetical protein
MTGGSGLGSRNAALSGTFGFIEHPLKTVLAKNKRRNRRIIFTFRFDLNYALPQHWRTFSLPAHQCAFNGSPF